MVYGAALEKRWAEMPRGFESHPLRLKGELGMVEKLLATGQGIYRDRIVRREKRPKPAENAEDYQIVNLIGDRSVYDHVNFIDETAKLIDIENSDDSEIIRL